MPCKIIRDVTLGIVLILTTSASHAVDLHKLWEDRCADCHSHSAEFARKLLTVTEGILYGSRSDRDLRMFLQQHYLQNNEEISAIYDMLLAQASTQARFKEQCGTCHASAAQLMRSAPLQRNNKQIMTHNSQQMLYEFLQQHVKLDPEQVQFFVQLMDRVDQETNSP